MAAAKSMQYSIPPLFRRFSFLAIKAEAKSSSNRANR